MKDHWPANATDEEKSLRLFKDALMRHAAAVMDAALGLEDAAVEDRCADYKVENAYARVREHTPPELEGNDAPTYTEVLAAFRNRKGNKVRERTLPPRQVLVHMLASLDYYFYKLASGYERVYDMPHLTDEERAAENGLRHDLLTKLYEELEPAFDVSLSWPPSGR